MAAGDSYLDDQYYRPIEAALERKHGIPSGLLGRIRKQGEKTNRGVVSSAGARSVYQIIPGTRDAFRKKYGVNAYAGDKEAAEVAALHLKESLERNDGDISMAVREYHGGPNRSGWGPINDAYAQRVTGRIPKAIGSKDGVIVTKPGFSAQDITFEDVMNTRPADLFSRNRPAPKAEAPRVKPTGVSVIANATQGTAPNVASGADASADVLVSNKNREAEAQRVANEPSWLDRVGAAIDENWVGNMILRGLDKEEGPVDTAWTKRFMDNLDHYTADAQDADEYAMMTSEEAMSSEAGYLNVMQKTFARRERIQTINSTENGWAFNVGTAALDPVGWLATAGVGKVAQIGRAAAGAGRAGVAGVALEGAAAGAIFTGAADFSGETRSAQDYLMSGAMGAAMAGVLHGTSSAMGKLDDMGDALDGVKQSAAIVEELETAAKAKLGPDATPAAISEQVQVEVADRAEQALRLAVGERPDADRFLPANDDLLRSADKERLNKALVDNNLENFPDPAERAMGAEMAIRADDIVAAIRTDGELDKGLEGRLLRAFGGESDAITMLRSKSPLLQAMTIQLLESTTGAGGRKASAAISMVTRHKAYSKGLVGYEAAYKLWRKAEGIGTVKAMVSNDVRSRFDREVVRELRMRSADTPSVTTNQAIKRAADSLEEGFDKMRREMQAVSALGHERLGPTSKGYFPQHINATKLLALSKDQETGLIRLMAKQLRELNEYTYIDKVTGEKVTKNFDKAFSTKLAQRYIDEAKGRARGGSFVPANLHTGEAASTLRDAVKAMSGLSAEEQEAILGRFSRGGPSFTKGRLQFNMEEDLGGGLLLGDIFENDVLTAYRQYSRRVAGEVALAQYGIFGRQGLDLARRVALEQGASKAEIQAFERVGAEFLNQPWGQPGAGYANTFQAMQNLRSITAAARLGMMPFTQLGESGNAIPVLGVKAVLGTMKNMPRYKREITEFLEAKPGSNPVLKDFDELYGFIGGDGYAMTRLFDAPDHSIELYDQASIGVITKAIRAGAHATSILSGFRALHATQVRGMSEHIVKKALKYIREGTADIHLDDMGITKEIREALRKHMDQIATFDKKGNLTSVNLLDAPVDPRIIRDFAQTIERGAGQIIQKTYPGETGAWAHNEFLKFLLTFRTFGITSIEKQYGRNVAKYGGGIEGNIKTFAIMVGSMAFALPIHMARLEVQSAGMSEKEREKFMDERTTSYALGKALMNYTSVTGLAPDALDIVTTFGAESGMLPDYLKEQVDPRGRQPGIVGMVAPIGVANDLIQGTIGARFEKLPKLLPGANTPFAVPIFNILNEEDE